MAGEFKGDFTRDTFHAYRHYTSVFQQQGRVSLDADGNEQASLLLNLQRSVNHDIIQDGDAPTGQFTLTPLTVSPGSGPERDFAITPGHIYVDGLLCALNGSQVPFTLSAAGGSSVNVSQWLVDGVPFQKDQYVFAFGLNPDGTVASPLSQFAITKADGALRALTLTPTPAAPSSGLANTFRLLRFPTFLHQPDYVPTQDELTALKNLNSDGLLLVYLDAWERHVSYVQNPWIREVALGGPDTCVRSQLLAQIKVAWNFAESESDIEQEPLPVLKSLLEDQYQPYNRGWLRARLKPVDPNNTDPCMCHPDARFRGSENQLYRVEIHQPGQVTPTNPQIPAGTAPTNATPVAAGVPTFKWSRNNGRDLYPVVSVNAAEIQVDSIGRDGRAHLKSGDWVELLDDILILQGKPGPLLQVSDVSGQDRRITLIAAAPFNIVANDPNHPRPFLRRWDQKDSTTGGISPGLAITESSAVSDSWIDLEDGIQIQFMTALSPMLPTEPLGDDFIAPANIYRTGDYWLIPARVALQTGIEWPVTTADTPGIPIALPPHGIDHHYLPLGFVTAGSATSGQLAVTSKFITTITQIT
jgi:hypothetical protein